MSDTVPMVDDPANSSDSESNAPPTPSGLVQVDHVSKSFGSKSALRDITFSVPPGQICGLLGPNGAGKTTISWLPVGLLGVASALLFKKPAGFPPPSSFTWSTTS